MKESFIYWTSFKKKDFSLLNGFKKKILVCWTVFRKRILVCWTSSKKEVKLVKTLGVLLKDVGRIVVGVYILETGYYENFSLGHSPEKKGESMNTVT